MQSSGSQACRIPLSLPNYFEKLDYVRPRISDDMCHSCAFHMEGVQTGDVQVPQG